jgi:hypothetical protein
VSEVLNAVKNAELSARTNGCKDFARATVLLDTLPDWLLDETLNVLQERTKGNGIDATQPRVKNLIWKNCGETLRSTMN